MHHPRTSGLDDDAADEEGQAHAQQGARDVIGFAAGGVDGRRHAGEGCRGTEVGRHLMLGDEDEDEGRDTRHHHCQLRVEAHEDGEDESCPEHRHHVLGSQPDGSSPSEPLVGSHHLTWLQYTAVVQLPDHGRPSGLVPFRTLSVSARRANPRRASDDRLRSRSGTTSVPAMPFGS